LTLTSWTKGKSLRRQIVAGGQRGRYPETCADKTPRFGGKEVLFLRNRHPELTRESRKPSGKSCRAFPLSRRHPQPKPPPPPWEGKKKKNCRMWWSIIRVKNFWKKPPVTNLGGHAGGSLSIVRHQKGTGLTSPQLDEDNMKIEIRSPFENERTWLQSHSG